MKKRAVLALIPVLLLGTAAVSPALTDEEYRELTASSPSFRQTDEELRRVWKEVYGGLSEKDRKYHLDGQRKWVGKWRDDDAEKLMKNGMSRADAYTKVTRKRINMLLIIQHNSRLSSEDIIAGRAWPDYYFEDWYRQGSRKE